MNDKTRKINALHARIIDAQCEIDAQYRFISQNLDHMSYETAELAACYGQHLEEQAQALREELNAIQ